MHMGVDGHFNRVALEITSIPVVALLPNAKLILINTIIHMRQSACGVSDVASKLKGWTSPRLPQRRQRQEQKKYESHLVIPKQNCLQNYRAEAT